MTVDEAAALFGQTPIDGTTWADFGCGDGTFTRALATRLSPGGTIHAIDRNRSAIRHLPNEHEGIRIVPHVADFTRLPLSFERLDGILMANSLHYVEDQLTFLAACEPTLAARRFLIVEYDTRQANPWVPFPIDKDGLQALFERRGYQFTLLGLRPSIYGRANIYAAMAFDRTADTGP